jgi:hypothetical protein
MDELRRAGDSIGARIDVVAKNVPVGLGQPIYDKLDADIAYAMMGINAVKGVEIGAGFHSVAQKGSEHGDELTPEGFVGNHAGGVLGGISTGQDITVSHRDQADVVDPHAAPLDRQAGQSGDGRDVRPPRPVRGHPRDADRGSDAGAGADRPRADAPRAVRRRARGYAAAALTIRNLKTSPRRSVAPAKRHPREGGGPSSGCADPAFAKLGPCLRRDDVSGPARHRFHRLRRSTLFTTSPRNSFSSENSVWLRYTTGSGRPSLRR